MARKNPYSGQSRDFLKDLDERLKINKGGFTAIGEDVGGNAFRVPGPIKKGVSLPSSMGFSAQQLPQTDQFQYSPMEQVPRPTTSGGGNRSASAEFLDKVVRQKQIRQEGVQQLRDGGVLTSDGTILYEDGTFRRGDSGAYAVQQRADGAVVYSDGTTREPLKVIQDFGDGTLLYNDGKVRSYGATVSGNGLRGLMKSLFGREVPVTQQYGNYNPSLEPNPQGINYGTDLGVSNEALLNPFAGARVIDIKRDDGQRFGAHQGYGNSVAIQLSTGEILRFSHLRDAPNFELGQTLNAGEFIGVTGATGNVTGPHLDLEYYNAQGEISNPESFTGLTNPDAVGVEGNLGQVVPVESLAPEKRMRVQEMNQFTKEINDPKGARQTPVVQQNPAPQAPQAPQGQVLGAQTSLPQVSKTAQNIAGKIQPGKNPNTVDLGVSEKLQDFNIPVKFGSGTLNTPLGKVSAPEFGVTEGLDKIAGTLSSKTTIPGQEGIAAGTSVGDGFKNTVAGVLQGASDLIKNLFEGGPVGEVYASGLQGSAPIQSTQPEGGQSSAPQESVAPEKSIFIKSLGLNVPESQKSGLLDRIYNLEQQGKTNVNSKKAGKLYSRFQELFQGAQKSLPAGLAGTPEGLAQVLGSLTQATSTGYASPEADKQAQELNAIKQQYYDSGLDYGSFDDYVAAGAPTQSINIPKSTKVPSSLSGNIQKTVGVQPGTGSATLYSNQLNPQESLSNAGIVNNAFSNSGLGSNFLNLGPVQPFDIKKKMSSKNAFDGLFTDLFKKLNPFN